MTNFKRFAIYYAPEPGELADFGARWLGWDLARGEAVPHVSLGDLDVATLTKAPQKYGLHGTLKPPFHLAEGTSLAELALATEQFCATQAPVTMAALTLARLGEFLALKPLGETQGLSALAGAAVKNLDRFRAPASDAEQARRRQARLSSRQEALLSQWGYPYVLEEFRFHITLTGRLPADQLEITRQTLAPVLAPMLPQPFVIRDLCLAGEDRNGAFHLIHRYPLSA